MNPVTNPHNNLNTTGSSTGSSAGSSTGVISIPSTNGNGNVYMFGGIQSFVNCFNKQSNGRSQINQLLMRSFPQIFKQDQSVTIFTHLNKLVENKLIKNEDVCTFVKVSCGKIIAFAQLLIENNPRKLRIINLCRLPLKYYKGEGGCMLDTIINYIYRNKRKFQDDKVYLTVGATKSNLQMYYKALGWVDTMRFDINSDIPGYEFVYYVQNAQLCAI